MSDPRPQTKRAACDRCRTQKLRCIRQPNNPTDACNRCVNSQMECVSSSSKRPGRPRNSTNASNQSGRLTPPPSNSSSSGSDSSMTAIDMQTLENVDWLGLDFLDPSYNLCSEPWTTIESVFPGYNTNNTEHPSLQPPNTSFTNTSLNNTFTETTQSGNSALHPGIANDNDAHAFGQDYPTFCIDPSVQLAVLQRELSVQMFALKSTPWDPVKALQVTSMPDSCSSSPDQETDYNPLAKIAKTTENFTDFLRSIGKKDGSSTPANLMPLLESNLSITDLLTVLSCHMLTLSNFDTIFSHFLDHASENPDLVNSFLQASPKLFVGGIAVPPRLDMLGYLLYSLAGSLLRPIEELLGLPDDFCVSLQRDRVGDDKERGLFSGQNGKLLFSTLLKMEEERMKDGGRGPGIIVSLKEKIRRVQGLA